MCLLVVSHVPSILRQSVVLQHGGGTPGRTRRHRRRACVDPGSNRLLRDRRCGPARRPLCVGRDRHGYRLPWRTPRNDLSGNRRGRCRRHTIGARPWCRLPVRRHDPDGVDPDRRRSAAAGSADAVRLPIGDHGVRQRLGDPDLHGAGPAADRRDVAYLRHDRRRTGDHLSAAADHQVDPLPARRDHRAGRPQHHARPAGAHGGRHGPIA